MDELFVRQAAVLRQLISDYREGRLGLNALIQRVEGISDVLSVEAWKDAVFPLVLSMEQVNASAIDTKRDLTEAEKVLVEKSLLKLEALIARVEQARKPIPTRAWEIFPPRTVAAAVAIAARTAPIPIRATTQATTRTAAMVAMTATAPSMHLATHPPVAGTLHEDHD